MNLIMLDLGSSQIVVGIVVFLAIALLTYVSLKILTRTAKTAGRVFVVFFVLVAAVAGTAAFYWFGPGNSTSTKLPSVRKR
ncbi:MAG: hypothetical protein WBD22_15010 [Pyrinomonadaceae bacterium]